MAMTGDLAGAVLIFLLDYALNNYGNDGDAVIHAVTSNKNDNNGYSMNIDISLLMGGATGADIAAVAGQITHETVELYFFQAAGVRGDSLPMDYLAEWEGGLVEQEVADTLGVSPYRSGQLATLGETYEWWRDHGNGTEYKDVLHYPDDPGTKGKSLNYYINPMGLSLGMLNWENTCGYESLSEWQDNGGC